MKFLPLSGILHVLTAPACTLLISTVCTILRWAKQTRQISKCFGPNCLKTIPPNSSDDYAKIHLGRIDQHIRQGDLENVFHQGTSRTIGFMGLYEDGPTCQIRVSLDGLPTGALEARCKEVSRGKIVSCFSGSSRVNLRTFESSICTF